MSEHLSPDLPLIRFVGSYGNNNTQLKNILIIAAIHGNEPCGVYAINELIDEGFFNSSNILSGTNITIMLGNPKAFAQDKRFLHENLNRLMNRSILYPRTEDGQEAPHSTDTNYERHERAIDIAREIEQCDILLDIHSTSSETPSFAIPTQNDISHQLIHHINVPTDFIVRELLEVIKGDATTGNYAKNLGKAAIGIECGQHRNPKSKETARRVIQALLNDYVVQKSDLSIQKKAIEMTCTHAEVVKDGFRYINKVEAFQRVNYGDLIAVDDEGEMKCPFPEGAFVIMPTALPFKGEEAWFWGKEFHS